MSLGSRQIRAAVKALSLSEYDGAVTKALLELGVPPFTPLQAQVRPARLVISQTMLDFPGNRNILVPIRGFAGPSAVVSRFS